MRYLLDIKDNYPQIHLSKFYIYYLHNNVIAKIEILLWNNIKKK